LLIGTDEPRDPINAMPVISGFLVRVSKFNRSNNFGAFFPTNHIPETRRAQP